MPELRRWKSKVDALIRLADDQAGKPEGELARQKLKLILEKYPEAAQEHRPLEDYAKRTFMVKDFMWMRKHDITTEGSWTGRNLQEALAMMVADYWQRIGAHQGPIYLLGASIAAIINEPKRWIKGENIA